MAERWQRLAGGGCRSRGAEQVVEGEGGAARNDVVEQFARAVAGHHDTIS
jgi:hypothetical protein